MGVMLVLTMCGTNGTNCSSSLFSVAVDDGRDRDQPRVLGRHNQCHPITTKSCQLKTREPDLDSFCRQRQSRAHFQAIIHLGYSSQRVTVITDHRPLEHCLCHHSQLPTNSPDGLPCCSIPGIIHTPWTFDDVQLTRIIAALHDVDGLCCTV